MTLHIPEWFLWLIGVPLALLWFIISVIGIWFLYYLIKDGVWK